VADRQESNGKTQLDQASAIRRDALGTARVVACLPPCGYSGGQTYQHGCNSGIRHRGNAWANKQDFVKAFADYGEAIRLDPSNDAEDKRIGEERLKLYKDKKPVGPAGA